MAYEKVLTCYSQMICFRNYNIKKFQTLRSTKCQYKPTTHDEGNDEEDDDQETRDRKRMEQKEEEEQVEEEEGEFIMARTNTFHPAFSN